MQLYVTCTTYNVNSVTLFSYYPQHILQAQAAHLPDGGAQLRAQKAMLKRRLVHLNAAPPKVLSLEETGQILKQRNIVAQSKMLTTGAIVHLHS